MKGDIEMRKRGKVFFATVGLVCASAIMMLFTPTTYATSGRAFFETDYGYSAFTLTVGSGYDMYLKIVDAWKVNSNNGDSTPLSPSEYNQIFVKLCNRNTGACTSTKQFSSSSPVVFTNLVAGTYDAYFLDNQGPTYHINGYVDYY